jgi:hypothetical protein
MGLAPQVDAWVSRWIVARAARVGAAIPKRGGCRPNIEIVFTSDPQGVLDFVAKKRDAYLGYHYVAQTKAFSTVTRPVEARYLTATRSVAGGESFDIAGGSSPSASSFVGDGSLDIAGGSSPSGCAGSSFTRCISSHFVNVLIVVDGKALNGRKVAPVADYIAMLALSQARSLEGCGALPSILDLLSSKCGDQSAPDAWTGGDTAYLRGLYSANLEDVMWLEKGHHRRSHGEEPRPDDSGEQIAGGDVTARPSLAFARSPASWQSALRFRDRVAVTGEEDGEPVGALELGGDGHDGDREGSREQDTGRAQDGGPEPQRNQD